MTKMILIAALVAGSLSTESHAGGRMQRWIDQLDLRSEQVDALRDIKKQRRSAMKQKRQEMKAARSILTEAMKGSASESDLKLKFQAFSALKDELRQMRFENILQIRKLLSSEQRERIQGVWLTKRGRRRR